MATKRMKLMATLLEDSDRLEQAFAKLIQEEELSSKRNDDTVDNLTACRDAVTLLKFVVGSTVEQILDSDPKERTEDTLRGNSVSVPYDKDKPLPPGFASPAGKEGQ